MTTNRYTPPIDTNPRLPSLEKIQEDLARESTIELKPSNEKEVHYHNQEVQKTKYSIVYLHGFSASRNELFPYPKNLATELKANVYSTRFTGHGTLLSSKLGEAKLKNWYNDALVSLAWGLELGEKVILSANSTGAPFALWLATHFPDKICCLLLTSPNMGPKHAMSDLLLYPGAESMTRLLLGKNHKRALIHPLQKLYWHNRYPSKAIITMMKAVEMARTLPLEKLKMPTLILYSKQDETVDIDAITELYDRIGSEKKKIVHIQAASGHLLGGISSPQSDNDIFEIGLNFLRSL
jgi:esterase/lipase